MWTSGKSHSSTIYLFICLDLIIKTVTLFSIAMHFIKRNVGSKSPSLSYLPQNTEKETPNLKNRTWNYYHKMVLKFRILPWLAAETLKKIAVERFNVRLFFNIMHKFDFINVKTRIVS